MKQNEATIKDKILDILSDLDVVFAEQKKERIEIVATALKHRQRSHRSYQQNRKVMGSVAVASAQLANSHHYNKMAHNEGNWLDTFKQMFRMVQKGDR